MTSKTSRSSSSLNPRDEIAEYLRWRLPLWKYVTLADLAPLIRVYELKADTAYRYLKAFEKEGWLQPLSVRTSDNAKVWTSKGNDYRQNWEHDLGTARFFHALALGLWNAEYELHPIEGWQSLFRGKIKPDGPPFTVTDKQGTQVAPFCFVENCRSDSQKQILDKINAYLQYVSGDDYRVFFLLNLKRWPTLPRHKLFYFVRQQDINADQILYPIAQCEGKDAYLFPEPLRVA